MTTFTFDPLNLSSRISSLPLKCVYVAAQTPQPKDPEPNLWNVFLETDAKFI